MTITRSYDWWVDGHYIAAQSAEQAKRIAARLYDFEPETVRRWMSLDD